MAYEPLVNYYTSLGMMRSFFCTCFPDVSFCVIFSYGNLSLIVVWVLNPYNYTLKVKT